MSAASPPNHSLVGTDATDSLHDLLVRARQRYLEDPRGALTDAVRSHELARLLGEDALCTRALALQSVISLHRGDLRNAMALALEAERQMQSGTDAVARAELAAVNSQLSFFTGSYTDALRHAELAIELADSTGDAPL